MGNSHNENKLQNKTNYNKLRFEKKSLRIEKQIFTKFISSFESRQEKNKIKKLNSIMIYQ